MLTLREDFSFLSINRKKSEINIILSLDMGSWSLNPEAPEFFPPSKIALVSLPSYYSIFPPTNPPSFLQSLHRYHHSFSADPPFSHYSYPHTLQAHFFFEEKAAVLPDNIEPERPASSSSLLETFKTNKMVLQEAQEEASTVAPKENVGGVRRSYKNKCHRKEGFVKADHSSTQARKKTWRPALKPSSYSSTGNNQHFGCNNIADPRNVQGGAANNSGRVREKHPPIPLKSDGNETTVMIRNIPNRFTREMLKDFLDQHCMLTNREADSLSAFDFLYLPIDFITGSNKGYAFVNFTKPEAARKFFDAWHDEHWDCFQSYKIREICCAKLQGMQQLMKHFERMEFPSENFQPLSFGPARDGSREPVKETIVGRCTGSIPNLIK